MSDRENFVRRLLIVEKHVRMRVVNARGIGSAALSFGLVDVYPAFVAAAAEEILLILVRQIVPFSQ